MRNSSLHTGVEEEQLWLIELQQQAETPFGASHRKAVSDEVNQSKGDKRIKPCG